MTKCCNVCGKTFNQSKSFMAVCSLPCRAISRKRIKRRWLDANRPEVNRRHRERAKTPRYRAVRAALTARTVDAVRARKRRYKRAHPEAAIHSEAARRQRMEAVSNAQELLLWPVEERAYIRQQIRRWRLNAVNVCAYCEKEFRGAIHVDHIIPIAKGGPHVSWNLAISCPSCNLKKGARDPWELGWWPKHQNFVRV